MEGVGKFAFFRSFRDALKDFDDASRLMFYEVLMSYAFDGVEPDFDGDIALTMAWTLAKPNVDSSIRGQLTGAKGGRGKAKGKTQAETTPGTQGSTTPETTPETSSGTVENPIVDNSEGGFEGGLKPPVSTDMDMDVDGDRRANAPNIRPTYPPDQRELPEGWKINPAVRCSRCGSNIASHADGRELCPTCEPLSLLPPLVTCSLCGSGTEERDGGLWCPVCLEWEVRP